MGTSSKKVLFQLLILVSLARMAAPVHSADVAVIMSADVYAYREALQGFRGTLRQQIVAEYDMEGDFDRGRKVLTEIQSKIKPDLIFAVGIWALNMIAKQTTEIPVVYAMVLNPPSVAGAGAKNITGASMNVPVELTMQLFKELGPKIRRVGIIFNPAKTGYLVSQAESVAREQGLQLIAKQIQSPREAIQALDFLQGKIDMLWILPDETILAREVVQYMLLFSFRKKVPLLGLSERQARMGAVLSLSFGSSKDIGRQAGELAKTILGGKTPGRIPYTTVRQVKLTVNLKVAQKLGMEIPRSILEKADQIIQ
jgi:putative ABC transport system substrate-binding protein